MTSSDEAKLHDLEIELLVQALKVRHGYDFGDYAQASLKRRVIGLVDHLGLNSITQLTDRVLHEQVPIAEVVARLSVSVSEMFRDPEVFAKLRSEVFPFLASFPHFNIWQAGCAHGEEVYSLAILLTEAGLYDRAQIYATDISQPALDAAREGIFANRELRAYADNYLRAGGRHTLSDYFHSRYGHIKFDDALRRNVIFATHNLAADAAFCEAQLILCRNVMIYFRPPLQQRAVALFRDSLVRGGYLCLGNKESLRFTGSDRDFVTIDRAAALYRLADGGPAYGPRI